MANRFRGRNGFPADNPFAVTLHPERLEAPLRWRKPRRVFVCSMGDLFHNQVPMEFLEAVFDIMRRCPQHIFQILTKRSASLSLLDYILHWAPNIWMGVSVENQNNISRLSNLLGTLSFVKFISIEPMLGPVDLAPWTKYLDWVICGCESGPGRRPCRIEWIRDLRDQCVKAGVPFFLKQMDVAGKLVKMPALDGRVWGQTP